MKYFFVLSILLLNSICFAELHLRDLDGDTTNGWEGVYDDVLDVVWIADANVAASERFGIAGIPFTTDGRILTRDLDIYLEAMNNHNEGEGYLGINTWRLPTVTPVNGVEFVLAPQTYEGATDLGYNIGAPIHPECNPNGQSSGFTGSELTYHYHNNFPQRDCHNIPTFEIRSNFFKNIQVNRWYHTGTEVPDVPYNNFRVSFCDTIYCGKQEYGSSQIFLWPLADGDAGVPMSRAITVPTLPSLWLAVLATFLVLCASTIRNQRAR